MVSLWEIMEYKKNEGQFQEVNKKYLNPLGNDLRMTIFKYK